MARTRPVWFQIVLGALAIAFTIAVLVGWNIAFTNYYVLATRTQAMPDLGAGYWVIASFGSLFLVLVVVAILLLLIGNIRQTLYVHQQNAFVDSVTHELKTPLASLSLSLETIESRDLSPEMRAKFVSMMKKDVDRLRSFIEHVLDAGRLEHGQRELRDDPTDLVALLEECAARIRQRHDLAEDEISLDIHGESLQPAIIDRIAFETIALNLLDNAVKYSPRPARVSLSLKTSGQRLLFTVRDQGMGIPRSELKKVFRRFYRIERLRKTAGGTGLGLYVVSALARKMAGRVVARSEGPDKGSEFAVDLPYRPAPSSPKTAPS